LARGQSAPEQGGDIVGKPQHFSPGSNRQIEVQPASARTLLYPDGGSKFTSSHGVPALLRRAPLGLVERLPADLMRQTL